MIIGFCYCFSPLSSFQSWSSLQCSRILAASCVRRLTQYFCRCHTVNLLPLPNNNNKIYRLPAEANIQPSMALWFHRTPASSDLLIRSKFPPKMRLNAFVK
ncbi:hypothetical protein K439DRAFT_770488 [Ramaria rubella]|nr:hypothetical protein K439DRAFT_770488 [Ramaria rubella]